MLSAEKFHRDTISAAEKYDGSDEYRKVEFQYADKCFAYFRPFKTADIEQTLVYGVHSSKELVVLLIK